MGFDAVIYEIDEDYYKAAVDRFERHKQQTVLEFAWLNVKYIALIATV